MRYVTVGLGRRRERLPPSKAKRGVVQKNDAKINFANPIFYRTFANEFNALKMMNTFVDTLDDTDVMEMQGDLTSEQRAYWESVIERDVRDRNKTKNYLTLDEFEQKLTAAAIKLYA